mgnify:CR=1 FL=1
MLVGDSFPYIRSLDNVPTRIGGSVFSVPRMKQAATEKINMVVLLLSSVLFPDLAFCLVEDSEH